MAQAMTTSLDVPRVFNFSAGPATLPLAVLEQIEADLRSYRGSGMSVMEMSHRSKLFIEIQRAAEQALRELLQVPADYRILFMQGGGRLQNVIIPLNFLKAASDSADYLVTGAWGHYSFQDAQTMGAVRAAWDGASTRYSRLPRAQEIEWNPAARYVHLTSNETIHGVQFHTLPDTHGVPIVCDSSSDLLSRPLAIADYGLVYACAQKNCGIAGLTIVIARDEMLSDTPRAHGYLSYRAHAAAEDQMFNTPPTFPIYVTGLVCRWILDDIGGVAPMEAINREKARLIYQALDDHGGFYTPHADRADRSLMNIVFRTPSAELDERLVQEAKAQRLSDLKGHRSLGGLRASLYNAMPVAGAETLAQFLGDFAQANG